MIRLLLLGVALLPLPAQAQGPTSRPLAVTIRAPAPAQDRVEALLARRDAAARRMMFGICRGCLKSEAPEPPGRMIEVSVSRPRASWQVPAEPVKPLE